MARVERSSEEIRAILNQLVELQEVDREMVQLRQHLATFPPKLRALDTRMAHEQQEVGKLDTTKTDTSKDRRRLEKDIQELEEHIAARRKRFPEIKTNKEMAAVNQEIEALRRRIDAFETRILEMIEEEEAHDRRVAQAREKLERLRVETDQEKQRIQEQLRAKNEKLGRLAAERERRRKAIPEDVLALYDRLSERHPGDVVCQALHNHCGGCHINLVSQKMVEIRQMKTFARCEGCLRIFSGEAEP